MLLLMYICGLFIASDEAKISTNFLILAFVFALLITTYLTSTMTGLILNLLMIFGYCAFIAIDAVIYGGSVELDVFFWIIWSPCMTLSVSLFSESTLSAVRQSKRIQEQLERLDGVDTLTELKNIKSYERICRSYICLADRFETNLFLVVWQLRYQHELTKLVGSDGMEKLQIEISHLIANSIWKDDSLFLLDKEKYTWGALLLSEAENMDAVTKRIAKKLQDVELKSPTGDHSLEIEMRIGVAKHNAETRLPLQLLELAKKNAQYDV